MSSNKRGGNGGVPNTGTLATSGQTVGGMPEVLKCTDCGQKTEGRDTLCPLCRELRRLKSKTASVETALVGLAQEYAELPVMVKEQLTQAQAQIAKLTAENAELASNMKSIVDHVFKVGELRQLSKYNAGHVGGVLNAVSAELTLQQEHIESLESRLEVSEGKLRNLRAALE
jgi:hypothetical protein